MEPTGAVMKHRINYRTIMNDESGEMGAILENYSYLGFLLEDTRKNREINLSSSDIRRPMTV
jgi:hypothetical protein